MTIQAITKSEFGKKYWKRAPNYIFSAHDSVCALSVAELPEAMLSMPLAFVQHQDRFILVAVQGLQKDTNLFQNEKGQWLGRYIPATYRTYPFILIPNENDENQLVLCIDGDSGLITEDETNEAFFNDEGELNETLAKLMDYLTSISNSRIVTAKLSEVLQKHNLFKRWDLQIQLESGAQRVDGLFHIDEMALNSIPDDAFNEIRAAGALPVIYSQLLSMQHIVGLTKAAQSKDLTSAAPEIDELNFNSMNSDGNISFDQL